MEQASTFKSDFVQKNVHLFDTFVRVLKNFTVLHRYVFHANWSFIGNFLF